jgi:hypothetical protein
MHGQTYFIFLRDHGDNFCWQICGGVRATKYTRAFYYGIGLDPARAWFNIINDKDPRGRLAFCLHAYLPRWLDALRPDPFMRSPGFRLTCNRYE